MTPCIIQMGVFAWQWRHPITGQVSRTFRSQAEAVLDWTQRTLYCLMNS